MIKGEHEGVPAHVYTIEELVDFGWVVKIVVKGSGQNIMLHGSSGEGENKKAVGYRNQREAEGAYINWLWGKNHV